MGVQGGAVTHTEPGAIVFLPEATEGFTEDEIYDFFSSPTSGAVLSLDDLMAAATVFHLPGQHDQSTHGHGGVSGHDALAACPIDASPLRKNETPASRSMTDVEYAAVRSYRNTGYVTINKHLRHGPPVGAQTAETEATIAALDSVMAGARLRDTITVTRGAKGNWLPPGDDLTGATFRDSGFVSTSASMGVSAAMTGRVGVHMTITAPAGTRAIKLSDFDDEAEILLDRGLTFRITADHGMTGNVRKIDVEVIPG